MRALDNQSAITGVVRRNRRIYGLLLLLTSLSLAGISCRNGTSPSADRLSARPVGDAITTADQLYAGRTDLVKVREGLVALRQGQLENQGNYDLAWRLAKFNYYLGAHTTDSTERDKAFHDGIAAGKMAVQLQDNKPEGHFWLGANYGGNAKNSVLAGLSDVDEIKRQMEAVIKLDEGFQSGSAYLALGQMYLEAPRVLGGDTEKAIQNLEKGLRFGPDNALLKAYLAEAYADAHRNEDARKQINEVLAMKPAAGFEPEHQEALERVRKLQEKIK
jgi:tetratricopeptide (TPR) repeat protein